MRFLNEFPSMLTLLTCNSFENRTVHHKYLRTFSNFTWQSKLCLPIIMFFTLCLASTSRLLQVAVADKSQLRNVSECPPGDDFSFSLLGNPSARARLLPCFDSLQDIKPGLASWIALRTACSRSDLTQCCSRYLLIWGWCVEGWISTEEPWKYWCCNSSFYRLGIWNVVQEME